MLEEEAGASGRSLRQRNQTNYSLNQNFAKTPGWLKLKEGEQAPSRSKEDVAPMPRLSLPAASAPAGKAKAASLSGSEGKQVSASQPVQSKDGRLEPKKGAPTAAAAPAARKAAKSAPLPEPQLEERSEGAGKAGKANAGAGSKRKADTAPDREAPAAAAAPAAKHGAAAKEPPPQQAQASKKQKSGDSGASGSQKAGSAAAVIPTQDSAKPAEHKGAKAAPAPAAQAKQQAKQQPQKAAEEPVAAPGDKAARGDKKRKSTPPDAAPAVAASQSAPAADAQPAAPPPAAVKGGSKRDAAAVAPAPPPHAPAAAAPAPARAAPQPEPAANKAPAPAAAEPPAPAARKPAAAPATGGRSAPSPGASLLAAAAAALPPLAGLGAGDAALVASLQRQLAELKAMYDELKAAKILELEGMLAEQNEYIEAQSEAAQRLSRRYQAELEEAQRRCKLAGSEEVLARLAALEDANAHLSLDNSQLELAVQELRRQLAACEIQLHEARAAALSLPASGQEGAQPSGSGGEPGAGAALLLSPGVGVQFPSLAAGGGGGAGAGAGGDAMTTVHTSMTTSTGGPGFTSGIRLALDQLPAPRALTPSDDWRRQADSALANAQALLAATAALTSGTGSAGEAHQPPPPQQGPGTASRGLRVSSGSPVDGLHQQQGQSGQTGGQGGAGAGYTFVDLNPMTVVKASGPAGINTNQPVTLAALAAAASPQQLLPGQSPRLFSPAGAGRLHPSGIPLPQPSPSAGGARLLSPGGSNQAASNQDSNGSGLSGQQQQQQQPAGAQPLDAAAMRTPGMTPHTARLNQAVSTLFDFQVRQLGDRHFHYLHQATGFAFVLKWEALEDGEGLASPAPAAAGDGTGGAEDKENDEGAAGQEARPQAAQAPAEPVHMWSFSPLRLGSAKLPPHLQEPIMFGEPQRQKFMRQLWEAVQA